MPTNKNAMTRYMILDELLSDQYHDYTLDDLAEVVSDRLAIYDPTTNGVGRRTIEKDIDYLEKKGPFLVEIERKWGAYYDRETGKTTTKKYLRYADRSFSIFKKELSKDEKNLLKEVFSLIGQFDGLPGFDALEKLRLSLESPSGNTHIPIISFTKNPLENSNLLGKLFTCISHKQVVDLHYHTFAEPNAVKQIVFHPYLLKEYNRRWFLIGAADKDDKILNFALDRINKVEPKPSLHYKDCPEDVFERFEDIIGVTFIEDSPVYKIVFWASDKAKDYIKTKPIHESQRNLSGEKVNQLRETYSILQGGVFFQIDCKRNYELIRELSSFGKDLVVLNPSEIRELVVERLSNHIYIYNSLLNSFNNLTF